MRRPPEDPRRSSDDDAADADAARAEPANQADTPVGRVAGRQVAKEMDVPWSVLYRWLRRRHPDWLDDSETWTLTPEQVQVVRGEFEPQETRRAPAAARREAATPAVRRRPTVPRAAAAAERHAQHDARLVVLAGAVILALCGTGIAGLTVFRAGVRRLATPSCPADEEDRARWPVKTLRDRRAARVRRTVEATTVTALRALPLPPRDKLGNVRLKEELRVYRVQARLVDFFLADDGDFHLTIRDPVDPGTMIVEFPVEGCTRDAPGRLRAQMERARANAMEALGSPSPTKRRARGTATITGVLFFDPRTTGTFAELHPVLGFHAGGSR